MSMIRRRAAALTAAFTLGLAAAGPLVSAPALAQEGGPNAFSYSFRVYLGGLPLGNLTAEGADDGSRYEAHGEFRVSGLLSIALDSDATARASGRLLGPGRVAPEAFSYVLRDRKETDELRLSFDPEGRPLSIQRIPDKPKRDREPDPSEVPNAIDPATAIYLLGAPRTDPCAFDHEVFDGRKLHRVTLSGPAKPEEGGAVVCGGVYERLKGFRDRDMTPDRVRHAFSARLTPLENGGWRPERIWAETRWGVASVARR